MAATRLPQMEITLDIALIRSVLTQEYVRAREEIAELGPIEAYERSQQRHDERLTCAPDAPSLACKIGCSWCCHFTVDVRPVEVARILEFVDRGFTSERREQLRREVETNTAALRGLDDVQRMRTNVKCPFLFEGRCSIYEARPQTCRNYHATDAAGCQKSYEAPGVGDIDPEFAPLVYQVGGAHVDAFCKALHEAGYDVAAYEMNSALAAALDDPAAFERRLEAKMQPALSAEGADVPLEFWEEGH